MSPKRTCQRINVCFSIRARIAKERSGRRKATAASSVPMGLSNVLQNNKRSPILFYVMSTEYKVKKQYDRIAQVYDQRWKRYIESSLLFLKQWLQLTGKEKILDVACGTGVLEELLLSQNPSQEIVGVDLSGNMLEIAKGRLTAYPNITFHQASVSDLPFAGETFDLVVCANSFHYFEDPEVSLSQMRRVLKVRGRLIVMDWCRDYIVCRLCDLFLKVFDPAHNNCYSLKELERFLASSGLRFLREQKFRLFFIWGMMIAEAVPPHVL